MQQKKQLTLCYIVEADRVLLGMKQRGLGVGRWNGFGGKLEPYDESLEAAAEREMREECGAIISLTTADKLGILTFRFPNDAMEYEVHVYCTSAHTGEIHTTGEMRPQWFTMRALPYTEMWESDKYWLPLLLSGKQFTGHIRFDENDHVLEYHIEEERG